MASSPSGTVGLRVAVTGANGFVGSHIVRELCRSGHHVIAIVRTGAKTDYIKHRNARIVAVDYADDAALRAALRDVDVLVHNAALATDWAPRRAFVEANVVLVERVIQAARAVGITRLVHISSNAVVGEEDCTLAKAEDSPYRPCVPYVLESLVRSGMNDYRETKAIGEQRAIALAQSLGLALTVLRPVWIYGPREFHAGPYEYCQTVLAGIPWLPGSRNNRFHAVYVGDVARAVVTVVEHQSPELKIYHIGPPEAPLQCQYFGRFTRALGVRQPRHLPHYFLIPLVVLLELICFLFRVTSAPLLTRARLYMFYANNIYDTRAITRDLGFIANTPLDWGVRVTVRWWQLCGYLPRKQAVRRHAQ